MDSELNLRVYDAEELRRLAYKNDIETYHSYIVENAKYGITGVDIELDPSRHALVIKKLKELFPDTLFTYAGISINKDYPGFFRYKASWRKLSAIKDSSSLKSTNYIRY